MISPSNMLKIVYDVVESDTGSDSQRVEIISNLLHMSPYQNIKRVHPVACGCTDCICKNTRPALNELEYEIYHEYGWLFYE